LYAVAATDDRGDLGAVEGEAVLAISGDAA
jgi:hypothetical protein